MIEIDYPNKGKIYCPACGKLVIDLGEGAITEPCPHVEFLGTDEGPGGLKSSGPEFDRNKLWAQFESQSDGKAHFTEYFKEILDDHYVCFTQCTPAPGGLCGHTIFKFPLD